VTDKITSSTTPGQQCLGRRPASLGGLLAAGALLQGCSLQENTEMLLGAVNQQRWAS